jgi:hypothetical protein
MQIMQICCITHRTPVLHFVPHLNGVKQSAPLLSVHTYVCVCVCVCVCVRLRFYSSGVNCTSQSHVVG